jgi:hypothetical protein
MRLRGETRYKVEKLRKAYFKETRQRTEAQPEADKRDGDRGEEKCAKTNCEPGGHRVTSSPLRHAIIARHVRRRYQCHYSFNTATLE